MATTELGMSSIKLKQFIFLQVLAAFFVTAVSCNSKDKEEETEIVVTPAIVAVKNFYLKANDSILSKLDSVKFSIDLNTGVIFNADSLPKGTNVTKLVASITFANTMTKAELKYHDTENKEVTVDYLSNPDDSINFSTPVTLDVTAQNGVNSFSYQIKVNVHNQEPDTLMWDNISTSILASRFSDPVAQKTVFRDGSAFSLIEEYNGEYTLSRCDDLNKGNWDKQSLDLSFIPKIESFTSSPQAFWILSDTGELLTSYEGKSWVTTNEVWFSIVGAYENSVLGIKSSGNDFLHTQYPKEEGFYETVVEDGFPILNASALGVVDNTWYPKPFAIIAGGITAEGVSSNAIWAYDGDTWAVINDTDLPALEKPMMTRYVVFRDTPYVFTQRQLDVWLLFGGTENDGEMNRKVYITYDNGVHWSLAPDMMQLNDSLPSLEGADVIVAGYELTADLAEAWTKQPSTKTSLWTRASYTIDGYDITWVCPYLYVFGGYNEEDVLSTMIWRGVLARLEFTPLI